MNCTCPNCQSDNAYFTIVDENGSHFECPDCDYIWIDDSISTDEEE